MKLTNTTLEEDLNNKALVALYKKEFNKPSAINKDAAADRLNQIINFDKPVQEQIDSIEKVDEFVNYDEKGKDIVQEWCKITINCVFRKRSPIDSKDYWDVSLELNGEKLLIEIKIRKKDSTYTNAWWLEQNKYNRVTELASKYNFKAVYCNIFSDNKMMMWDMEICKTKTYSSETMNNQTMGNNDYKKEKNVYSLNNNEAFLSDMLYK